LELNAEQDAIAVGVIGDHNTIVVESRRLAPDPRHVFKKRPDNERVVTVPGNAGKLIDRVCVPGSAMPR
jgi:hypothetical protein